MRDLVVPAAHAFGCIVVYKPGGSVTVGTARESEGDYIIVPMDV